MSDAQNTVHPRITDSVTQTSSHVLGLGPAMAAINAYLGQTQAQTVLYANMVNQQQQLALIGLAVTTRNIGRLMKTRAGSAGGGARAPLMAAAPASAPSHTSVQSFTYSESPLQPVPPVVT